MHFKQALRILRNGRPWQSGHSQFLLHQIYHRNKNAERRFVDADHLRATASWLAHAQDTTGDGGVCGRYHLGRGWSSSYPETTGYILPTFLKLADHLNDDTFIKRARQCAEFLLPLQFESGAFPGMEVAHSSQKPSPFNTAQILHGLIAWHRHTNDPAVLESAVRAGDWLLSVQDSDGAFRKHYYNRVAAAYSAHASCWLAELGDYIGEARFSDAAERNLDWVLSHYDERTGFFDYCGFDQEDFDARRGLTHTIAYTLWGTLFTADLLRRDDGVRAVRHAAEAIARRTHFSGRLPGVLNHEWRSNTDFVCLTGNAQMAIIWMRLHELSSSPRLLNTAFRAIDDVKAYQSLDNPNPALRGAVAGSGPVWGQYINMALPNWAAKYFIDALIKKQDVLERLPEPCTYKWTRPVELSHTLPPQRATDTTKELRIVILCGENSWRPSVMIESWQANGLKIRPVAFLIERYSELPILRRLQKRLGATGIRPLVAHLLSKVSGGKSKHGTTPGWSQPQHERPEALARTLGIQAVLVDKMDSTDGVQQLTALMPDLAIHAGAGIHRASTLAVPRLGTLNAHMGILPQFRGMNVAEWAVLQGDPVGCTVHIIDEGIDTGDVLAHTPVNVEGARSVVELREQADKAQLAQLGQVVEWIRLAGELPPRYPQQAADGVQFFTMHPALLSILEERLASRAQSNK